MMIARSFRRRGQRGSASVELLGLLPILMLLLLTGIQLFLAAFTAASAADAARAGARAASKGRPDATLVAMRALSPGLRDRAIAVPQGERFVVTVRVPIVLPPLTSDRLTLTRSATMPFGTF
jgi:ABC-type amino acid transport system permease subunit